MSRLLHGLVKKQSQRSSTMASQVSSEVSSVVRASNAFAFAMYRELAKKEGDKNFFFSPMSITAALAMTHLGAAGNTAEEIKSALNAKDINDEDFHSAFSVLNEKLNTAEDSACILRMANRVFARKNFAVKETFSTATKKHYAAEAQVLDFAADSENSRTTINKWVEDQTNQKIQDLLQPGTINSMTAMVLVNAIYFKGSWLEQFDAKHTRKDNWTLPSKETTKADIMFKDDKFKLSMSNELQGAMYAEVPYKGKELSMGIVLPKKTEDLAAVQDNINVAAYEKMVSETNSMKMMLFMPKFKIETSASLKEMLQSLGISSAFESHADFTNIADASNLYLSEVVHKAFVEVNEEGTEAAAATAAMIALMSMPFEFKATHPFIFFIKDDATGAILFMGRVMNPNE
uniref:Serpin family B-like protein n=1 Tax=Platynereis dumerilii TaxID=6359 RepID=A0A8F3BYU2_PLADU|nr:serpin family B-like protein [Platynereis dumerilii]